MTVVVLRGTSGSGKTYIVQRLMEVMGPHAGTLTMTNDKGREKLAGYTWPGLSVVGRYETACGGCDAFSWKGAADDVQRLVLERVAAGDNVVLEGLTVSSWSTERFLGIKKMTTLVIVRLTTRVEDCLAAVRERREARFAAKGEQAPTLNEDNTRKKHREQLIRMPRDRHAGLKVEELDRAAALARVLEIVRECVPS